MRSANMARFYFDLTECGNVTLDDEGIDRSSMSAVRAEAISAARDIMSAEVLEGSLCLSCAIQVRDATGAIVLTLPFKEALSVTGI